MTAFTERVAVPGVVVTVGLHAGEVTVFEARVAPAFVIVAL